MRILINTSVLRFGGAVQVALSVVRECRRYREHEFHVVLGPGLGGMVDESEFPENFRFHRTDFGPMGLLKVRRVQREMDAIEAEARPDCVVTTSGPSYWRSRAPHLMGFNLPLYIYPESPYLRDLPVPARARLRARKWVHRRFFRRDAEALIVQTDDVNQRVRRLLGTDHVHTVTNNHAAWYEDPSTGPSRLPDRAPSTFRLLTVSSYYPHKNLELIPAVMEALPDRLRNRVEFVLTLTEEEYRRKIARELPRQVQLTGPVPPPECPGLYAECDAMFLPTLAECFSASYPEAMRMERPIVTTDLGFARSICRDAALYFAPCDAESAADAIVRLVEDESVREDLVARGRNRLTAFDTPAERADKIIAICEGLLRRDGLGAA